MPYDPQSPTDPEHFFELVLDYGEHDAVTPTPNEVSGRPWDYRADPFSTYRAGFEIRTNRLCRRALMFHKFEELGEEPYLVRSLSFDYEPSAINESGQTEATYLARITQTGYIRKADGTYASKSLPPMEFDYQRLNWDTTIKTVSQEAIVHAPVGLTNNYQWVDLYGEGISGILSEHSDGWFYKSNLGDVKDVGKSHFTPAKKVVPKPSFTGLNSGVLSLQDLDANGEKQMVINTPEVRGFFELDTNDEWKSFKAFEEITNLDLRDPNTRLIDLNGDGQPELVITQENAFVWHASKGKKGYAAAEFTAKTFDEDKGPAIVFADSEQSIFLADMSGDGLTDIVRIRNSEICYWANLGYGRFSAKVSMTNAPWFDHPELFNPAFLHLADVSGTGATDIIYTGRKKFKAFVNLSGNAWSDAHDIEPFFRMDQNSQLSIIDLMGSGTSCIVWSSDLPGHAHAPMKYIDLMGGKKPHVLTHYRNNLGKETTLEYKSSTHFYLEDKLAGKPWITKLPFPVQVVSKISIEEKITDVRFTSEYRYHHGYYDHPEREFRGFGMVEQVDSEHYESWSTNNAGNQLEQSEELYQKPELTKTWFHTGAFLDRERILMHFKDEYWLAEYNSAFSNDPLTIQEPELVDTRVIASSKIQDSEVISNLTADEWREALRACKGMTLRQEVFALDAPTSGATEEDLQKQMTPYSIATHNCLIQLLQPRNENPHGVFIVTESEAISIHYERNPNDPRIAHTLNTKLDELGNVLEAASVVYPRRNDETDEGYSLPPPIKAEQKNTFITYTSNSFTHDIVQLDVHRLRALAEIETFELNDLPKSDDLYQLSDFEDVLGTSVHEIDYHIDLKSDPDPFLGAPKRRLIEHVRTIFYNENLTGPAELRELATHGIPYENYQLAYTPGLLTHLFGTKITDPSKIMTDGRFVHSEGDSNWWIRSGVVQLIDPDNGISLDTARNRFFSPISYTDPFGPKTTVEYYKDYFLFVQSTVDALENRATIEAFDFRTVAPRQMRDINDNLSEVLMDELGLVKAVAILGKDLNNDGIAELEIADNLSGLSEITEAETADIDSFFQSKDSVELDEIGRKLLGQATSRFLYDFDTYRNSGKPVVTASITRETHHGHLEADEQTKLQISFEYSDGLGNVAMVKAQAEPGVAKQLDLAADDSYTVSDVDTKTMEPQRLRWIGNGLTVLNNKGNPVKQYEPYFSVTPHYENAKELVKTGVTPILYYDPLDRLIRTELPDQTFSKVEFDAWKQVSNDPNDTVMDSQWYVDRGSPDPNGPAPSDPQQLAAWKAAQHHNTPSRIHFDSLGRPILSVEHNRKNDDADEFIITTIELLDRSGSDRMPPNLRDIRFSIIRINTFIFN